MTISARVIADSIYEGGPRITTFVLRYPRFIHAEFMTHRDFSRNAASSRAIPVAKMIQAIKDDPAMPVYWGKNQAGMQAAEELGQTSKLICEATWLAARDRAIEHVEMLLQMNLHKQIANRILEPWMHIEVVVTATNWDNFYALRDHPMAQPEIQALAAKMIDAHNASTPNVLQAGEWHLPYIDVDTGSRLMKACYDLPTAFKTMAPRISAARCARVSYLNHEGKQTTFEEDLAMFDRLMGGDVKHASPTEHQARVPGPSDTYREIGTELSSFKYPSNLRGWVQHRKLIQGETIRVYDKLKVR